MDILIQYLKFGINFLFLNPKSTTTMIVLLLIIIVIAAFVERKRDALGKVSFSDRSQSGVIGLKLFELTEDAKTKSWFLPLWIPQNHLLLHVRILLQPKDYEVRACWKPSAVQNPEQNMFEAMEAEKEKEKTYVVSPPLRFKLATPRAVAFQLMSTENGVMIDSPDKARLELLSEDRPFPLPFSDSSIAGSEKIIDKTRRPKIWELSINDDRIYEHLSKNMEIKNRKLDAMTVKQKELESNLDKAIAKIKQLKTPKS